MIKNNLGKIVFSLFILFLPAIIYAKVLLQSPDTFYKGDVVIFKIIAAGSEIKLPELQTVDGYSVSNAGTSRNTTIRNSQRSFQLEQAYSLIGQSDIHIPSFEIMIDNKIEKTQAKVIKMLKVEKTKSDLYDLTISVDKKDVYVGEAIEFTLKFKYKKDLEVAGLNYNKPKFENFWVKELKPQKSQNNYTKYVEQEIKYLLFPQKAGAIELEPVKIDVSTVKNNYGRGFYLSSPTVDTAVYSNKIKLNIKELPSNVNLIGDFTIKSTIDKTTINQGEAVSFKLNITGRGNIDDLDEVKLDIPNTTIYDNPSKKEYDIKKNIYGGKYNKTYSIVGKDDFIIPSISLKYFDKKSGTVKIVKTKAHEIKVNKQVIKKSKLEVAAPLVKKITNKEEVVLVEISKSDKLFYFLLGLLSSFIIIGCYFFYKKRNRTQKEIPLLINVKKAKTSNELFKILLVYINIDEELDKIIYKLEDLPRSQYKEEKSNILKVLKELIKKGIKLDI
jgi:hypothetical protein